MKESSCWRNRPQPEGAQAQGQGFKVGFGDPQDLGDKARSQPWRISGQKNSEDTHLLGSAHADKGKSTECGKTSRDPHPKVGIFLGGALDRDEGPGERLWRERPLPSAWDCPRAVQKAALGPSVRSTELKLCCNNRDE